MFHIIIYLFIALITAFFIRKFLARPRLGFAKSDLYYSDDKNQRIVMIGSHEIAKEYFKIKDLKRDNKYLGYIFNHLLIDCVGAQSGELWLRMKKPLDSYFNSHNLKKFDDQMQKLVNDWFSQTLVIHDPIVQINKLNFNDLTMKFLIQMICEDVSDLVISKLEYLIELHDQVMEIMVSNIWLRYNVTLFQSKDLAKINELKKEWNSFVRLICANPSSFLKSLMSHESYNENRISHTLYELIIFNADIMVNALSWLIWDISTHPDVQTKIQKDLKENKSDYLDKVINESARLHPGVLQTFSESNTNPIELSGVKFPKSTIFSIDVKMVNTDPKVWPNPQTFDPDRFNESNNIHQVLRFGLGSRKCIGRLVADQLIRKILIKIYSVYRTYPIDQELVFEPKENLSNIASDQISNLIMFKIE